MNEQESPYSKLIKMAALLVKGGLFSTDQEEYAHHVPKWLIRRIELENDYLRSIGIELRKVADELSRRYGGGSLGH
jgi:hypothetical protein